MSTIAYTPTKALSSTGASLRAVATLISDGSGNATQAVTLTGWIVKVVTNPDASAAPTADWDLTIVDEDALDILVAAGADRHTSNSELCALPNNNPIWVDGIVTVTGANMGDTKTAVVRIYVKL
jgi:hypothetical protein